MLLALAPPWDEAARSFADYAASQRIACIHTDRWQDIRSALTVERNGATHLTLRAAGHRDTITGVLNRYSPSAERYGEADRFRAAEILAGWWSLLGSFSGPVVNRPSSQGFLPRLDTLTIARHLKGFDSPRAAIGALNWAVMDAVRFPGHVVNVHRLRDGRFVGRLDDLPAATDPAEVYLFTAFNPDRTTELLVAGETLFDLAEGRVLSTGRRWRRLRPLVDTLHSRHATFCRIVLERTKATFRILSINSFPALRLYAHIERAVNQALLEFLIDDSVRRAGRR